MKPLGNILERAASTFLYSFGASVPTTIVAFDASVVHALEVGAATAGLATLQSLVKNINAYFQAQGNGPDVPQDAGAPILDTPA